MARKFFHELDRRTYTKINMDQSNLYFFINIKLILTRTTSASIVRGMKKMKYISLSAMHVMHSKHI